MWRRDEEADTGKSRGHTGRSSLSGRLQGKMLPKKPDLTTPWSQTSRLQYYEKINFCHLNHSTCGILLRPSTKLIQYLTLTEVVFFCSHGQNWKRRSLFCRNYCFLHRPCQLSKSKVGSVWVVLSSWSGSRILVRSVLFAERSAYIWDAVAANAISQGWLHVSPCFLPRHRHAGRAGKTVVFQLLGLRRRFSLGN